MLVKWDILVYKQSIVVSIHRLLCRIVELKKGVISKWAVRTTAINFPGKQGGIKFPNYGPNLLRSQVGNRMLAIVDNPARKSTPLFSCPPQVEDSFYPLKMVNPPYFLPFLESTRNGMPGGIPLEESSAVTSQVEYSYLPPKTDGPPHFHLLWSVLLIPSVWGEFSKRGAPSEFLSRRANHVTWLWDRTSGVMTASFRKSSDKTTCIFICQILVSYKSILQSSVTIVKFFKSWEAL